MFLSYLSVFNKQQEFLQNLLTDVKFSTVAPNFMLINDYYIFNKRTLHVIIRIQSITLSIPFMKGTVFNSQFHNHYRICSLGIKYSLYGILEIKAACTTRVTSCPKMLEKLIIFIIQVGK